MRILDVTPEALNEKELFGVIKHLPGQHDQKTHGSRRGGRLARLTEKYGGVTYSLLDNDFPKEGFALSIYPEHERILDARLSRQELAREINRYLEDNKELLRRPDHHFGSWRSPDGKIYLDISVVVKDNKIAQQLAIEHRQLAYYDLKRGETIEVKQSEDPESREADIHVNAIYRGRGKAYGDDRENARRIRDTEERGEGIGEQETAELDPVTHNAAAEPAMAWHNGVSWTEEKVAQATDSVHRDSALKEITGGKASGDEGAGETRGERAARFWQENWHKLYPKSGKGRFVLHEHWMGLSEDEVKLPREELIKRGHSLHSDLRLESDDGLHGWTVFLGKAESNTTNRLLALPPDDNLQVAPKVVQPKGWLAFEGVSEPGEVGATAGKYARFDIVDSGTYEVGVWREHMMEYFFHGKKLRGRLLVQYAPLGGRRVWIIDRPEDQRPYAETRDLEDVVKELKDKGQKWLIWRKPGEKPRLIDVGAFEFEKAASRRIVPIAKVDLARQIVYGIVLDPYIVDSQGDWVPVLEVERAAHKYLVKSRTIGDQHQRKADAELVESWLVPYPTPEDYQKAIAGEPHKVYRFQFGGSEVHSGAWVVGIHVISKQLWQEVQSGAKTGLSIGAIGERIRDVKQSLPEFEAVEPDVIPVFVAAR